MSKIQDDLAWQEDAACKQYHPEIFTGDRPSKAVYGPICNSCPVRSICLETAIANKEIGIWGGTTEAERRNLSPIFLRAIGQYRPSQTNPEQTAIQALVSQAHERSEARTKEILADLSELLQSLPDIS